MATDQYQPPRAAYLLLSKIECGQLKPACSLPTNLTGQKILLLALLILSFCSPALNVHAAQTAPQPITTQPLAFDGNNIAIVKFSQSAEQATLLTIPDHVVDLVMFVEDANNNTTYSFYSVQLLKSTLFIAGETCQECSVAVKKGQLKDTANTPLLHINIETFSADQRARIDAERTIQKVNDNNFNFKKNKALNLEYSLAIEELENQNNDSSLLRACDHKTNQANYTETSPKKISIYNTCLQLAKSIGKWDYLINSMIEHTRHSLWFKDKNTQALQSLEKIQQKISLHVTDKNNSAKAKYLLGRNLLLQGMIYSKSGKYAKATKLLQQANELFLDIGNLYNLAETQSELGIVLRYQNRYSEAAQHFEEAFQINLRSAFPSPHQHMRIHYNMAGVSLLNGQLYLALKLIETIDNDSFVKDNYWLAHIRALKARILLELNRLDEAEALYKLTWPLYESLGSNSHLATLANNLSRLYTTKGDINKAKQYTEQAVTLAGDSWGTDQAIRIQQAQVNHHLQQGEYNLALTKLFNIEENLVNQEEEYRLGRVMSQKGETLRRLQRFEDAIDALKEAKVLHEISGDHLYATKSNYQIANTYFNAGHPPETIQPYINASKTMIESIRSSFIDDRIRQEYFALQKDLFELDIKVQLRDSSLQGNINSLYQAENFKARTLFENMTIENLESSKHERNEITFDFLTTSFKSVHAHPEENPPRPKLTKSEMIQHQQSLSRDEAILYYFLGQSKSYAWLIKSQDIDIQLLPSADELTGLIDALVSEINTNPATSNSRNQWENILTADKEISATLLGSIGDKLSEVTHLTIIPDGVLHRLPFSILLSPKSNYKSTLNKSLSISYANSIATLSHLQTKKTTQVSNNGLLLIANPTIDSEDSYNSNALATLPAAEREAKRLLALWGTASDSKLLLGHRATKEEIYNSTSQRYQVIHFASHAFIDWDNPANSAIKLASPTHTNTLMNPDLTLNDISKLKLNTEMVVLSACETAAGKLTTGEGPIGLSRAFFEAGANRVLASLWPVDDEATAKLFELFYEALLELNHKPDEALQFAQQELMKNQRYSHPYYWSGFIFIGNNNTWPDLEIVLKKINSRKYNTLVVNERNPIQKQQHIH